MAMRAPGGLISALQEARQLLSFRYPGGLIHMTDQQLGRLERVELRDIWISEATSFTPWLARPENIAILSETLNIDLELEAQERAVGPFRADLLCRDIGTDRWVLIENQLERTDHTSRCEA
jgi:hypothetical protein